MMQICSFFLVPPLCSSYMADSGILSVRSIPGKGLGAGTESQAPEQAPLSQLLPRSISIRTHSIRFIPGTGLGASAEPPALEQEWHRHKPGAGQGAPQPPGPRPAARALLWGPWGSWGLGPWLAAPPPSLQNGTKQMSVCGRVWLRAKPSAALQACAGKQATVIFGLEEGCSRQGSNIAWLGRSVWHFRSVSVSLWAAA